MNKTKQMHLDRLLLQEGLREYFLQQSTAPALPTSPNYVREAFAPVSPEITEQHTFGMPDADAPASPVLLPEDSEDKLFRTVGAIILAHYCIQNPAPEAAIGVHIPPLTYVNTTPEGAAEIILMPFPVEAEVAPGRVDGTQLDPDMLEKLELLFEHLEEVANNNVRLRHRRETFQFVITTEDPLALLHLFEDLMLSQNYPCRDTLHFDTTLERHNKTDDGQKCFATRKEFYSYLGERTARDRISAKGIADVDPETFLSAIPARVFTSFAEASRISIDYQALCENIPYIDISFAALEDELCRDGGIEFNSDSAAPPLLRFH